MSQKTFSRRRAGSVARFGAPALVVVATTLIAHLLGLTTQHTPLSAQLTGKTKMTLSGSVTGLYPGATKTLKVKVSNPYNFAVKVTSLTAKVKNRPGCAPKTYVRVTKLARPLKVKKKKKATAKLTVSLLPSAPDACRTTFPMIYKAKAVKA